MVDAAAAGAARAAAVPAPGRRRRRARPRRRAGVRRQRLRRPGGHRRRAGQPRADGRLRAAVGRGSRSCRSCSATSSACSARGARSGAWSARWWRASRRRSRSTTPSASAAGPRWPASSSSGSSSSAGQPGASRRRWRSSACSTSSTMFVGMSLYGVEPWSRKADPFGVYFGIFASLAPVTRRDGVLYARPPVVGAIKLAPLPGTVALVIACDRHHGVRRRQRGDRLQLDRAPPAGLLPLARLRHRSRARAHVPARAERDACCW